MAVLKLLGIAGTDGSGKDSLAQLLAKKYGWHFISVTDILREEAKKRGVELQRNKLREISAEWRREHGLGVLVDKAVETYKSSGIDAKGLVIASLRNPGEADSVHALGGKVVWTDADPEVRYGRISSRNRGTEDHVTFEQFQAEEKAQSQHSGDEATLSLTGVKDKADIFIENSSSDLKEFESIAEQELKEYL
jgi:dephospho-CoA kinase